MSNVIRVAPSEGKGTPYAYQRKGRHALRHGANSLSGRSGRTEKFEVSNLEIIELPVAHVGMEVWLDRPRAGQEREYSGRHLPPEPYEGLRVTNTFLHCLSGVTASDS